MSIHFDNPRNSIHEVFFGGPKYCKGAEKSQSTLFFWWISKEDHFITLGRVVEHTGRLILTENSAQIVAC